MGQATRDEAFAARNADAGRADIALALVRA
ncbi:hypothetical protein M673_20055 (plasmid) [Aureimonas sp. AU20]|nr:hypothetical protein M673_20055 [Aureimonas sp. AU20]